MEDAYMAEEPHGDRALRRGRALTARAIRLGFKMMWYLLATVLFLDLVALAVVSLDARVHYVAAASYQHEDICKGDGQIGGLRGDYAGTPYTPTTLCEKAKAATKKEYWAVTGLFLWGNWHIEMAKKTTAELTSTVVGQTHILLLIGVVYHFLYRADSSQPPNVHVHAAPTRRRVRPRDSAVQALLPSSAELPAATRPRHKAAPHLPDGRHGMAVDAAGM
jgi:hypothetical protein